MGKKRSYAGQSASEDKKRRKERADQWKNTRGDARDTKDTNSNSYTNKRGNWGLASFDNAENKRFTAFYQAQMPFLNPEALDSGLSEFDTLLKHLRMPLPACFRISADFEFKTELTNQLMQFAGQKQTIVNIEGNTEVIEPVKQLEWYPNSGAYQLGADRRSIRKLDCMSELHEWMKLHTDNGNITRQEAVSMVPPIALNVQPHHKCLDMCAAPGSKTSQLLEIINRSLEQSTEEERQLGYGLVVANDSDTERAYMLVHQCRRINSPLLVVTTHKGQGFPSIRNVAPPSTSDSSASSSDSSASTSSTATPSTATPSLIASDTLKALDTCESEFFDRVLCDVPCSGDGTLRKNPAIWEKWATNSGVTLHPLQLMIAQRGLQLLKPGGLMVYSTCSLSPFENESCIAELLRSSKGQLELVDARQFLPLFRARPGLSTWHVIEDFSAIKKDKDERYKKKKAEKNEKRWVQRRADGMAEGDTGKPEAKDEEVEVGEGVDASSTEASAAAGDGKMKMEGVEEGGGGGGAEAEAGAKEDKGSYREQQLNEAKEEEAEVETIIHPSAPTEPLPYNIEDLPIHLRKCVDMGMTYYPTFDSVPKHLDKRFRQSMFPPTKEEQKWMHLERCMRCLPHDEDTGGFFVATLRKKSTPIAVVELAQIEPIPIVKQSTVPPTAIDSSTATTTATAPATTTATTTIAEGEGEVSEEKAASSAEPVVVSVPVPSHKPSKRQVVDFRQFDPTAFEKLKNFYGFDPVLLPPESLYFREDQGDKKSMKNNSNKNNSGDNSAGSGSTTGGKSVYYLPAPCRALLAGDSDNRLKIVTAGVKVFERKSSTTGSDAEYRLLQDGVRFLGPFITNRKLTVTCQDFCNMLSGGLVSYSTLSKETIAGLDAMTVGPVMAVYTSTVDDQVVVPQGVPVGQEAVEVVMGEEVEGKEVEGKEVEETSTKHEPHTHRAHTFYMNVWRTSNRVLNVMCGKTDLESMKHQLQALRVYRPKTLSTIGKPPSVTATATKVVTATESVVSSSSSSSVQTRTSSVVVEVCKEGDTVPEVTFTTRARDDSIGGSNPFTWRDVSSLDLFKGKRVVIFSLPGAFTPTCSLSHLPGYEANYEAMKALGVDEVYCLSVNDAFVMRQWGLHQGLTEEVTDTTNPLNPGNFKKVKLVPDGAVAFTRAMGMSCTWEVERGFGERSWRYSAVFNDMKVEKLFIEGGGVTPDSGPDPFEVSTADTMMSYLQSVPNSITK